MFIRIHIHRYSMEILLFVVEIVQYQNWLDQHMDDQDKPRVNDEDSDCEFREIKLADNIVQSAIVECKEELHKYMDDYDCGENVDEIIIEAKIKGYKLYQKYIKIGSEFEINISSQQRDNVIDEIDGLGQFLHRDDFGLNDMKYLFEASKDEMWKLLQYSFTRFRFTDEFNDVMHLFGNKEP